MAKGKKGSVSAPASDNPPPKKECKPEKPFAPNINIQDLITYYRAINDTLTEAFKSGDRLNLTTSWGNYIIFMTRRDKREFFFVHNGCTCNMKCMPRNMEYFQNKHEMVKFIVNGSVMALLKNPPKKECCFSKCAKNVCQLHNKKNKTKISSA